ncbi:MAG: heavy-metal-associated domain-containing protein [Saprospiraceae bacterium]|nr:heavy-metal-associated domain-containing protein [Saprospiraceae bacterium]
MALLISKTCAQSSIVRIGINGLSCSACVKSVEMQIRKLDFVTDLEMDIIGTEALILVQHKRSFELNKLVRAVYKAGFSVRDVKLKWSLSEFKLKEDGIYDWFGMQIRILNQENVLSNNEQFVQLVVKNIYPSLQESKYLENIKWRKANGINRLV